MKGSLLKSPDHLKGKLKKVPGFTKRDLTKENRNPYKKKYTHIYKNRNSIKKKVIKFSSRPKNHYRAITFSPKKEGKTRYRLNECKKKKEGTKVKNGENIKGW